MTEEEWHQSFGRRMDRVERELDSVRTKLSDGERADAVEKVHRENVEKRLTEIEGTLTWLVRLIIGAIVLALIGFVVGGGIVGA